MKNMNEIECFRTFLKTLNYQKYPTNNFILTKFLYISKYSHFKKWKKNFSRNFSTFILVKLDQIYLNYVIKHNYWKNVFAQPKLQKRLLINKKRSIKIFTHIPRPIHVCSPNPNPLNMCSLNPSPVIMCQPKLSAIMKFTINPTIRKACSLDPYCR